VTQAAIYFTELSFGPLSSGSWKIIVWSLLMFFTVVILAMLANRS
jgi:hypothetical protein